jgi:fructokinase
MFKIGLDLGGTKIEGIILDKDLNEILRKRIQTEQNYGYEHILNNITKLYQALVREINDAPHTLGIGTPGSVSFRTGLLKNSNTVCMNGRPFLADLEKKTNKKLAIENDANCFAMAEAIMGAGKGYDMVFGVIMGTGCGGGIVYKGEVIKGPQSIAGEWGHHTIAPSTGPKCYCGKKGCAETFISGGGLENRYRELTGKKIALKEILDLYRNGDKLSVSFMKIFFENFGVVLSNMINILDPDVVVLGGGVSNIDELYTFGIKEVYKNIFNDEPSTKIVKNQIGDSAGVWGAALIGI